LINPQIINNKSIKQESNSQQLIIRDKFVVVVPAAGVGKRMLSSCPKQYLTLDNQTILSHTITRLLNHKNIAKVIVAISDNDEYFDKTNLADNPNVIRVSGGKERVDSVLSGLQIIADSDWVLVHDAARPCITHADIDKLISQCLENKSGGILAAPVVDTMKRSVKNNNQSSKVAETINRDSLWHAYTPQMFKVNELKNAIVQAKKQGLEITDEASAIEFVGLPCLLISGRRDNIKITRPEDLVLAGFYLKHQLTTIT
jgi:2-C-methyl-D-erythritol 4-phosphate cytidylyltransferase